MLTSRNVHPQYYKTDMIYFDIFKSTLRKENNNVLLFS